MNDRRGHINHSGRRRADYSLWSAWSWRISGIGDGVIYRMSVNGVCDDARHGDTGEDFSDGRPFAIASFGGLQACACES